MAVRVVARLFLFLAALSAFASAQQHPTTPQQIPAAHVGACEALSDATAKFQTAETISERTSFLRLMWNGYQQQLKLKQKDLHNHLCLTQWHMAIFTMNPQLIDAANIPVQPEVIWGDVTGAIEMLKRMISAAEQRGDADAAAGLRGYLGILQSYLDSGEKYSVLRSFLGLELGSPFKMHTPTSGGAPDGYWPVFTVKNRFLTSDLTNVSVKCTFYDSNHNAVWTGTLSIPRLTPQETVKVAADGDMIRGLGSNFSYDWSNVQFEIRPTSADVETIVKNTGK